MAYCWYFTQDDLEQKTPSREDGLSYSVETRYRKDGSRFIINASNTLGLRHDTLATGVVYFHRFFMMQSFKHFDRWVVAAACLFLAGKVEETPKKCRDIIKVTESLLNEQQMRGFGSHPREELLTHERILLQTIKFDLQLQHPYIFLLKYGKALRGDKAKIEKLVQMAWTFVNDSFSTTLCLQWEPQAIAVAFLYLAGKLTKFDLQSMVQSKSRSWWRQFVDTLDIHDLETICHQVLDLYGETGSNNNGQQEKEPAASPATDQSAPPTSAVPGKSVPPPPIQLQQVPGVQQQNQSLLGQPPMSAPPTNHVAPAPPTSVTSLMGAPPTTFSQSHATFFNPMGLSFIANPLQALQSLRPTASQQQLPTAGYSNQPSLAYSSLGGPVGGSTGTTTQTPQQQSQPQQVTGYSLSGHTGSPAVAGGSAMKTFQPTTPVGLRGNQQLTPQQLSAQKLTPQQMTPHQMATQQMATHQMSPLIMATLQMATQQMTPQQQIVAQNLTPQHLATRQMTPQQNLVSPQQLPAQHLATQQLTPQQMVTRQITPQQLSAQNLTPQQLNAPRMAQQQLNIQQQQSFLVQQNTAVTHSLPQHAGTYSPVIRNMGTRPASTLQTHQVQQTAGVVPSYTTLPPGHQQRLVTVPHMVQQRPLAAPQQQLGTIPALTQHQLPQTMLGAACTASSLPTHAPPILTQHSIPATMPTGLRGAVQTPLMNIGLTRAPQQGLIAPTRPQLTTPTRPQLTTPVRPPGGQQPYNMGGVGRGWGGR